MHVLAALIQFPEPSTLAIVGVVVVGLSIVFGLYGNDFVKKLKLEKATDRMHHQAVIDIYEDKKLSDEESVLMDRILDRYAPDNPLKAVTTRGGYEACIESEMKRIAGENNNEAFKKTGLKLRDIRVSLGLDFVPIGKPIYSTRELHTGQIISVATMAGKNPNWVRMLLKSIDEAYLYISLQSESTVARFDDGESLQCKLWHDEDAQYEFHAKISFHGESDAQWRLSHNTEKMNRTQSREHFRMRFEQNTSIGVLNVSEFEEPQFVRQRKPITTLRAKITSLSAGGCAIVFAEPIAKHVFLRIDVEIPGHPVMQLDAKIIATSNISGGRSLVRARFIAAEQEERDLIARFLRKKQQATIIPDEVRK